MRNQRSIFVLILGVAVLLAGCTVVVESSEPEIGAADTWTETTSFYPLEPRPISQSVSPDGRWLATAALDICIYPLTDTSSPVCANEETIGADSLSWNPDSSGLVPGGSTSGRFNATGVWIVGTDGSTTEVSPVEEGSAARGDQVVLNTSMAFRPDGDSIVFLQVEFAADRYELMEVDVDGQNQVVLAELDSSFWGSIVRLAPLDDGRVVMTDGEITDPVAVLIDSGNRTVLATGIENDTAGRGAKPPWVVQATSAGGGLALVAYPGDRNTRGTVDDPTRWSLITFEGDEFPLTTNDEWQVVTATLSPDGNQVAFVRADVPGTEPATDPAIVYVTTVAAVMAGEPELDSRAVQADIAWLATADSYNPGFITWTIDNRLLIAVPERGESEVAIIELDLSAGQ